MNRILASRDREREWGGCRLAAGVGLLQAEDTHARIGHGGEVKRDGRGRIKTAPAIAPEPEARIARTPLDAELARAGVLAAAVAIHPTNDYTTTTPQSGIPTLALKFTEFHSSGARENL